MFFWSSEKADFGRVSGSDESDELLADSSCPPIEVENKGSLRESWFRIFFIVALAAFISFGMGALIGRSWLLDPDGFSILHSSQYSPIVDEVGITYTRVQFNGSLLQSNIFRQDAGPEVDAAWRSLGVELNAARIPSSKAARSGLASDQVRIKEKYGGGFPANVEGLHHLHCLNLLRKSLAWNFEYYKEQGLGAFSNHGDILKYHTTHCLDILRQQLMCTIDIGVLGQVWYQPQGRPVQGFVDFNTVHKCRNFDAIRDWAEKHQLPDQQDIPRDFLEMPKKGDRIYHQVP